MAPRVCPAVCEHHPWCRVDCFVHDIGGNAPRCAGRELGVYFRKCSTKAGDAFLAERFAAVIEGLDEERRIRGGFVHVLVEIRLCPTGVRTPSRGRAGGAREVRLEMFEGALRRPGL